MTIRMFECSRQRWQLDYLQYISIKCLRDISPSSSGPSSAKGYMYQSVYILSLYHLPA